MAHKFLFKSTLAVCLFFTAPLTYGETFVAHDDSFRIDENTGWQEAAPMTIDGVLALEKDKTRLDIRRTECTNETCLDQLVNQDLAEIKSKNMTVTPNATTGQEINRVEFASGEPFFYIHFAKGASRFSAGYFLINGRVYSVLVKNAVFDQIDPLFAAISPLAQTPQQENAQPETDDKTAQQDALTERSYDTEMMPEVEADGAEHTANAPAENTPFAAFTPEVAQPETEEPVSFEEPVLPEVQTPAVAAPAARPDARKITPAKLKHYALRAVRLFKSAYREGRITTFIAPNMPPYLKALGRVFDVAVLFVICFILLFAVTALLRLFIPVRRLRQPINPHSSYPVRIRRLYGTPAVVCRARDNQGKDFR